MTSKLPEGWKEVKLVEVADYINSKISIEKCNVDNYISTTNMIANKGGIILAENLPKAKSLNFFKEEDILVSNIRPYFRKIWFAEFNGTSSTDILIFRAKKHVYSKFLYYVLSNNYFFDYSTKSAKGTKMPRGDKKAIMNYLVPKITLIEQNEIADTLSALDDKIELNNKINENLEEQAQTIFKHWFINFEFPDKNGKPYKSSGGEMVDSELGMIPKGWEIVELNNITNLTMGLSPKSDTYNFDEIGMPLLNGATDFEEGLINATKYTSKPTRVCKKNDLVFCIRATIGNITFADKEYCIGRGVASLTPKRDSFKGIVYHNLLNSIEKLVANASGSVILGLSKPDINNMKIILPDNKILTHFRDISNNVFDAKNINDSQNRKLSQLRDTLLPKLMSGEIRIPLD